MFADDIVLVAESPKMLQKMLDVVYAFSRKYRFRFNQKKSNVMIFGRKCSDKFYLGESELALLERYKYLGLVLDKQFSWKIHLGEILGKARKRMKALWLREGISARAILRVGGLG